MHSIPFKKLHTTQGIPVYFQKLPEEINPVAVELVVWAGSGDDTTFGMPGLHHWFEHVPFRGTKKFPEGAPQTMGHFRRYGGSTNAYTSKHQTSYEASVPSRMWKEGVEVVVELAAHPLLREDDIHAERKIIHEEIRRSLSSIGGYAWYHIPKILYPEHPLGNPVLGSIEDLDKMDVSILRSTHVKSYDKNRMAFFISGNIDGEELIRYVSDISATIPDRGLTARDRMPGYVPFPAWQKGHEVIETQFDSSYVVLLFPATLPLSKENLFRYSWMNKMMGMGAMAAPLLRILREERKLVYSASSGISLNEGGGFLYFCAETGKKNIEAVQEGFVDVINDPELRSKERFDYVKDGSVGSIEMHVLHPYDEVESAVLSVGNFGRAVTDEEMLADTRSFPAEEGTTLADSLIDLSQARTIVFKGK